MSTSRQWSHCVEHGCICYQPGLDTCRQLCAPPCVLQAWLAGGDWHRLLPADHEGLPEVKWCMNRFVPFLAIDPQPDPNPGSRDAEESSMEVRGTGVLCRRAAFSSEMGLCRVGLQELGIPFELLLCLLQ